MVVVVRRLCDSAVVAGGHVVGSWLSDGIFFVGEVLMVELMMVVAVGCDGGASLVEGAEVAWWRWLVTCESEEGGCCGGDVVVSVVTVVMASGGAWWSVRDISEDALSVIATKLDSPLMLDSYTATIYTDSWGRASYARAIIELKANVDLRDTIVVVVTKFSGEGFTTSTIRIEYDTSMWDQLIESDDHEVEFPDDVTSRYISSTRVGGLCEDDLDFYDRYEAEVYDLPEQMQTFCDQFDIRLRSRVRK
ncbi:hypothetical protein Tco_1236161 [Tanacetum coccineum]